MDLFDIADISKKPKPLAERMRASALGDFIGQEHIVGKDTLLRRAITAGNLGSCIFYGPPGTGKTTLANIIANISEGHFEKLNAVSSGVADAKKVIEDAKNRRKMYGDVTYLLLDECHRWNKAQSDCVLAAIEIGDIIFIGSTTENPYVAMTGAIVSRCRIFEFKRLSVDDIVKALRRAAGDKQNGFGNYKLNIDDEAFRHIAFTSAGDLRTAYNALELAVVTTSPNGEGAIYVTKEIAEQSIQKKALSVDDSLYYDMLSAFCKSLRGSDAMASLYYAMRLIEAGCDPMLLARRLVIHSAEDVGMADPNALNIATSAMYALEKIGLPEAKIPLSEAIIYVAETKKSNRGVEMMGEALELVRLTADAAVPKHLRDTSYMPDKNTGYLYPHDFGGYVEQQYLPDDALLLRKGRG
jgi:putative ATPase